MRVDHGKILKILPKKLYFDDPLFCFLFALVSLTTFFSVVSALYILKWLTALVTSR